MNNLFSKFLNLSGSFDQLTEKKSSELIIEDKDKIPPAEEPFLTKVERKALETFRNDLLTAFEEGRITVHYQPIVTKEGNIQCAEALIRWYDPDNGYISPDEFIPLAEKTGLIEPITKWMIVKVCEQLKAWKIQDRTVCPISVNISPLNFANPSFVHFVKETIDQYIVSPKLLIFEITETSFLEMNDVVKKSLQQFRSMGIKIAIDDFGTGYSSFEYLRNFDFDKLKIDQIFIKYLDVANRKDTTIVSSIIHLAKGLGINLVAEGVEKYEQYQFLKQQECPLMQGYIFAKPAPVVEFESTLQKGKIYPNKLQSEKRTRENRKYFRFDFPYFVEGKMTIVEVNQSKVDVGSANVLIKDISLGGMKIHSNLSLPVISNMLFRLMFTIMGETFHVMGRLRWKNNEKANIYTYGFEFDLHSRDENRLALLINKMSALRKRQVEIPDTPYVYDDLVYYFAKQNV